MLNDDMKIYQIWRLHSINCWPSRTSCLLETQSFPEEPVFSPPSHTERADRLFEYGDRYSVQLRYVCSRSGDKAEEPVMCHAAAESCWRMMLMMYSGLSQMMVIWGNPLNGHSRMGGSDHKSWELGVWVAKKKFPNSSDNTILAYFKALGWRYSGIFVSWLFLPEFTKDAEKQKLHKSLCFLPCAAHAQWIP